MKPFVTVAVFAALLAAAGPCFALWDVEVVSKERARKLGVQVRTADGPGRVIVRLEFKTAGELKGCSSIELQTGGKGGEPLRVDRSKPGRAAVSFAADPARLDKMTLRVMVLEEDGGSIYELRIADLAEPKIGR